MENTSRERAECYALCAGMKCRCIEVWLHEHCCDDPRMADKIHAYCRTGIESAHIDRGGDRLADCGAFCASRSSLGNDFGGYCFGYGIECRADCVSRASAEHSHWLRDRTACALCHGTAEMVDSCGVVGGCAGVE